MEQLNEFKRLMTHKLDHILRVQNASLESRNVPMQFSLIILTSFGHIEGEYLENDDDSDLGVKILSTSLPDTIFECPPVIMLKNARITPYGHNEPAHIIETMTIFTDQIVGLSFK